MLDLQRSNVAFSRTKRRLFVVASQVLFDHIPSEVDVYATARLWKHLRHLCSEVLGEETLGGHHVSVMRPGVSEQV